MAPRRSGPPVRVAQRHDRSRGHPASRTLASRSRRSFIGSRVTKSGIGQESPTSGSIAPLESCSAIHRTDADHHPAGSGTDRDRRSGRVTLSGVQRRCAVLRWDEEWAHGSSIPHRGPDAARRGHCRHGPGARRGQFLAKLPIQVGGHHQLQRLAVIAKPAAPRASAQQPTSEASAPRIGWPAG